MGREGTGYSSREMISGAGRALGVGVIYAGFLVWRHDAGMLLCHVLCPDVYSCMEGVVFF